MTPATMSLQSVLSENKATVILPYFPVSSLRFISSFLAKIQKLVRISRQKNKTLLHFLLPLQKLHVCIIYRIRYKVAVSATANFGLIFYPKFTKSFRKEWITGPHTQGTKISLPRIIKFAFQIFITQIQTLIKIFEVPAQLSSPISNPLAEFRIQYPAAQAPANFGLIHHQNLPNSSEGAITVPPLGYDFTALDWNIVFQISSTQFQTSISISELSSAAFTVNFQSSDEISDPIPTLSY